MPLIQVEQLRTIMPRLKSADALVWTPALDAAARRFNINSRDRLKSWLANLAHESNELSKPRESTYYTSVARIRAVFKRVSNRNHPQYRNDAQLRACLRQPEEFANFIYSGINGNGDEASGDGWRYRGGGPIGLTFKNNYAACGMAIGVDLVNQPELIETVEVGALSAAWFWEARGLNQVVDSYDGDEELRRVTVLINGGLNGLDERDYYTELANKAFGLKS